MHIALGETNGMIAERGFAQIMFHVSNVDDIRNALERMLEDDETLQNAPPPPPLPPLKELPPELELSLSEAYS